jgi:hypothetical protein
MNALTNRVSLIAASALVFGTMAFGQTPVLKAQIPFDFRTAWGTLPAGTYTIRDARTPARSDVVSLRNEASKQNFSLMRQMVEYEASSAPVVVFRCGADGCALSAIRQVDGTTSFYGAPQSKRDKEAALISVPVYSVKAD